MKQSNDPGQQDPREGKGKRITLWIICASIIIWTCLFTWRQWNAYQPPLAEQQEAIPDDSVQINAHQIPDSLYEVIEHSDGHISRRLKKEGER